MTLSKEETVLPESTDPQPIAVVGTPNKVQPGPLLTLVAGIAAILIAAVLFFATVTTKAQQSKTESDITVNQNQLTALQPTATELNQLSQDSADLHSLFDKQPHWESVLAQIEQRLYKNMRISSLELDQDGTMSISGITPGYVDFAKIFNSLTDDAGQKYFTSVHPTAITKSQAADSQPGSVSFSFTMKVNPSVLQAQ